MENTTAQILESLYASLTSMIFPQSKGEKPKGFTALMLPGVTVQPKDYNPKKPEGRQRLYALADTIPAFSKMYLDSTQKCSQSYQQILRARSKVDNSEKAKKLEKQRDRAEQFCEKHYDSYKKYREAYDEAKKSKNKKAMKTALMEWEIYGNKQELETNLAVISQYCAYSPVLVFNAAREEYEMAVDDDTGMYPARFTPATWYRGEQLSWTKFTVDTTSEMTQIHSDYQKIDSKTQGSLVWQWFSASGDGDYSKTVNAMNSKSTSKNMSLSCELAVVNITRDWFYGNLLNYKDCYVEDMEVGGICTGDLASSDQCVFPYVPSAIILARNVVIRMDLSDEEKSIIDKASDVKGHGSLGIGPFRVTNSTHVVTETHDEESTKETNNTAINIGAGMQIIAVKNTLLSPCFPHIVADISANAIALDEEADERLSNAALQLLKEAE